MLHTYGNLSDAQLLQTYGFLDSEDGFAQLPGGAASGSGSQPPEAAAEEEGGNGGKKGGKKRGKAGASAAKGKEEAEEGAGYRNPYNAALVPWEAVEDVCCGLMKSMDQVQWRVRWRLVTVLSYDTSVFAWWHTWGTFHPAAPGSTGPASCIACSPHSANIIR